MNDITSKELKDITGMSNSQILNALAILSVFKREDYENRNILNLAKLESDTFYKYYSYLDNLGFYDN